MGTATKNVSSGIQGHHTSGIDSESEVFLSPSNLTLFQKPHLKNRLQLKWDGDFDFKMHEIRMKIEPEEPDFSDILTELEELESELKDSNEENDFDLASRDLNKELPGSWSQKELENRLRQEKDKMDDNFTLDEAQNTHYFNLLQFEKAKKVKNIVSIISIISCPISLGFY